ncbi:cytochrome B6 [Leptolyngbya cf. ectocarpi LEGE 11479]|uniref:Cytochrome B6 n=1 Tax=Leptolyngbya cf. ectocarpi LEGE 11479 TaxID=1828722 RepID=A0A928ZTZ9_LEPEC|nr:cytochrome c peroxidase [Leptolyngbya ectocarpi]MBE9067420.1 cytochrome B6 [Leptolyngbya cf. ectocarpi LEGE 11479]
MVSRIVSRLKSNRFKKVAALLVLFCFAALAALGITRFWQRPVVETPGAAIAAETVLLPEPIQPIPLSVELDENKVQLGRELFNETRLSADNTVSCATCHALDKGGTDRKAISTGMAGGNTGLNSPTVFNTGFMHRLNWDGSARTLEEQTKGPIESVGEMGGMSWQDVVRKLGKLPKYGRGFDQAYQDGLTPENVRDAIAVYQRALFTPNAPFDQYLRGQKDAISDDAKAGYDLFKSYGCVSCHQGMLVGGNMFQTLGIFGDYFTDRGTPITEKDLGRYNVTQNDLDKHVFKVPTLRNVTLTSPYFHDGNPKTLDQAIKLMGQYQLGVDIPQTDVDLIMQFLQSLTGEIQE